MKIAYFTHSLASCWNHGNAHFLRGVLSALIARGHDVRVYEPAGSWSLQNLLADHGEAGLDAYRAAYPELSSTTFAPEEDPAALIGNADLIIVHEWNDPALVAAIARARVQGGRFTLLFHDTHHRAVSAPHEMQAFDLSGYDGVLAFGEALSAVYRRWGWGDRVWTWHEAADIRRFHPPEGEPYILLRQGEVASEGADGDAASTVPPSAPSGSAEALPPPPGCGGSGERHGLVWIGNWGDGERTAELESFLFAPAREAGLPLDIYGVRYPEEALVTLRSYGARYHGWAPNAAAPGIFARHLATVHVPRRFYTTILPGIPTIRVFEALACGIPLVSAPWEDAEHLFTPGRDYLVARDGAEMTQHLTALANEPALRADLAAHGLAKIRARHTCDHRADELLAIVASLAAPTLELTA